mmetsp:Transcript_1181/g.3593  ORF Transcript_1181/g.3593 Transcript_1181/m.3593 type:complete len:490 (+) Transcript_1181:4504-5973(+)
MHVMFALLNLLIHFEQYEYAKQVFCAFSDIHPALNSTTNNVAFASAHAPRAVSKGKEDIASSIDNPALTDDRKESSTTTTTTTSKALEMKLINKSVDKDGKGQVSVIVQEEEDLWHLYQLIAVGNQFRSTTFRRVQRESSTGSTESERVKITLTLNVEKVDYNPGAESMRISGKNATENKWVKLGAHHTFDVSLHMKVTLIKTCWDSVDLERIDNACNPAQRADLCVVVMEEGLAHVCLVTETLTLVRARVEQSVPGKRKLKSQEAHAKAMNRFFENVFTALERHLNFEVCKCVVLASPGFVKDEFHKFMMAEAQRRGLRAFVEHRDIFVLCHASSGHKHSVSEILQKPEMQARLGDTKAAGEVKILHQFFQTLKDDDTRAYYGPQAAVDANELQAIDHLLITEELFRAASLSERKKYVALVESVRENGGQVHIFSSLHTSGEQLQRLTGIAVILRYPIPDLDVHSDSDSESDSDNEPSAAASCSSQST